MPRTASRSGTRRAVNDHCKRHGVTRTGGFCANKKSDPSLCTSVGLARTLAQLLSGSSVLDLGCGRGGYGRYFAANAPSVRWLGLDGAEGIEEVTDGFVSFADLSNGVLPPAAHRPWEWVMSLEVAEHLTRAAEPSFVHQLVSRATKGVLLSWAAPLGPAGWHHINCQSAVYVECAMAQVGLQLSANLTDHLRRAVALGPPPRCPWLKSTLLAFAPIAPSTPSPLLPLPPAPSAEWSSRYLSVTQCRCPFRRESRRRFSPTQWQRSAAS